MQEGELEGPNTSDPLPEEDTNEVDGAVEPVAALDVADVDEEAETGEEPTAAQESNDYTEDGETHEDVEENYPDLPDDDDDEGFEVAPHEAVDEPVLPMVLHTSDETQDSATEDIVGQDTYEEVLVEESVRPEDAASTYADGEFAPCSSNS